MSHKVANISRENAASIVTPHVKTKVAVGYLSHLTIHCSLPRHFSDYLVQRRGTFLYNVCLKSVKYLEKALKTKYSSYITVPNSAVYNIVPRMTGKLRIGTGGELL